MAKRTLTVILAGGRGTRLDPLTRDRAKPAVPFGGIYRIVDFTLSNCLNSGLRHILILTQFKSRSLDRHLRRGWGFLSSELNEGIEILPPQQRIDENWYKGTADAIYQNIYSIEKDAPENILILAGDHIYKMDYAEMIQSHRDRNATLTIGCIPIPLSEAPHFGILNIDSDSRVVSFQEKPPSAEPMPGDPTRALGSMGIYVFNTRDLFEQLCEDAADETSSHDFGKDVIPKMIHEGERVYAHHFKDLNRKSEAYWRDVGTIEAYYQANMDLISVDPQLNLYDAAWPIRTAQSHLPPPKFVFAEPGEPGIARRGQALDSLISPGCILSGGIVLRSVLSPQVRVNSYAMVEDSILMDGVEVGRHSRIRRAIIDKEVKIPPDTSLGYDPHMDTAHGLTTTPSGIVLVPKGTKF
jgi:glucose-1-phosphate adenylyltransferase